MSDTIQSTKNGNSLRMLLEITGEGKDYEVTHWIPYPEPAED